MRMADKNLHDLVVGKWDRDFGRELAYDEENSNECLIFDYVLV